MLCLDHTCQNAAENLALDEALLEQAEAGGPGEVLRLWESPSPVVIVGRSSRLDEEVHLTSCRRRGIAVLRRASGGAAVVAGPGCLMYAVILSYARHPQLQAIDIAHAFVLQRLVDALLPRLPGIARQGTSDLTLADRKFSGNSMRAKRHHLLYHGTLLYEFPLRLMGECLKQPPRQPDYRQSRAHGDFVANLPLTATELKAALVQAWNADEPLTAWPRQAVQRLATEKYGRDDWTYAR
jgi:lipoate-protein ligase A